MLGLRGLRKRIRNLFRRPRLIRVKAVSSLYAYGIAGGVMPKEEQADNSTVSLNAKFERMETDGAIYLPPLTKVDEIGQDALLFEAKQKPKAHCSVAKKTSPPPGFETPKMNETVSVPRKCSPPSVAAANQSIIKWMDDAAELAGQAQNTVRPPLLVLPGTDAWFAIPGNERYARK